MLEDIFRKERRIVIAPPGELGGIVGETNLNDVEIKIIKLCEECNVQLKAEEAFLKCSVCGKIVHPTPPCGLIVNGRSLCRSCVEKSFPLGKEGFLVLAGRINGVSSGEMKSILADGHDHVERITEWLVSEGLLRKSLFGFKLTRLGYMAYSMLWQIYSFDPDVVYALAKWGCLSERRKTSNPET